MSNYWETAERISKVVGALLIPVVLGAFGWIIQDRLAERSLSRDYGRFRLAGLGAGSLPAAPVSAHISGSEAIPSPARD